MRRHRARTLSLVGSIIAAVLLAGTAVAFPTPARAAGGGCINVDPSDFGPAVLSANVIVVGLVVPGETTGSVGIRPEAFLKGSALPADILLQPPTDDCPPAKLQAGDRVLAFLAGSDGQLRWPGASQAWTLDAGQAQNGAGDSRTEANLVSQVRSVTGQYAVPAPTSDTGIRITWKGTILPLAAALALVFGVGLVLMRTWHRIDPT